nr:hypothetical protein [Saccharopolyspora pogona]
MYGVSWPFGAAQPGVPPKVSTTGRLADSAPESSVSSVVQSNRPRSGSSFCQRVFESHRRIEPSGKSGITPVELFFVAPTNAGGTGSGLIGAAAEGSVSSSASVPGSVGSASDCAFGLAEFTYSHSR